MKWLFLLTLLLWPSSAHSQKAPATPVQDVALPERWRIPGEIAGQKFGRIVSVVSGDGGRVFLVDGQLSRVYVVSDKTGMLTDSFGKEGEGPGDLNRAQFAFAGGPDCLNIVRLTPPAVQSLTYAGGYLEDRFLDFDKKFVFVSLSRVLPMSRGYVVSGMSADVNMNQAFFVAPVTTNMEMSSPFVSRIVADHGNLRFHDLTFDAPRWATDGTDVFISSDYSRYLIDVYSFDGSARRRIAFAYEHLPRSKADMEYLKDYFRGAGRTVAAVDVSVASFHRDIENIYVLPGGRLLVLTSRGAGASNDTTLGEFDVVDITSGRLVRRVRLHGEGNPYLDNYVILGSRLFVVSDMQPPAFSAGQDEDRDIPYMSVICYELRI